MSVALLLFQLRARITAAVRRRHPRLCLARVDDAVSVSILLAVEHPERFEAALRRDGPDGVRRLGTCVARRAARDQARRLWYQNEVVPPRPAFGSQPPAQEFVTGLPRDLHVHLRNAARAVSAVHEDPLTRALADKLDEGAGDGEVAARYGVRREYVNRAWRRAVRDLL